MKSGTVSVIGRPSAGKSTLVNTITGMKVSITSPVPQTTRNKIRGIYTDQRGQLVFTDTTEEEAVADMIAKAGVPVVAVINKNDILTKNNREDAEFFLRERFPSSPILFASASEDEGVDEILIELFKVIPEGELMYDENTYTDQDLEFRISEIIREKTMATLSDELPHTIYVEIEDMEYSEESQEVWIRAVINTEREGQKGIIVGRGGENIKRIRKESFKEIRRIFPGSKLTLDLRVKADPKWRSSDKVLGRIFR